MKAEERRTLYQFVFRTVEGQKVLADLLRECGMSTSAFHADSTRITDHNLGRQHVGRILLKLTDPTDKKG